MRAERKGDGTDKDIHWPGMRRADVEDIKEAVCRSYGYRVDDLYEHGHKAGEAKRVAIGLACRLSGKSNREIGVAVGGLSGGAVAAQQKRFGLVLKESKPMQKRVERILDELGER